MSKFSRLLERVKELEKSKVKPTGFDVAIRFKDGTVVNIDEFYSWPEEKQERFSEEHDVGEWDVEKIDVNEVSENYT